MLASFGLAAQETYLVVPFFNVTQKPSLDWIGESVAETVQEGLLGAGLSVIPREDRREAMKVVAGRSSSPLTLASVTRFGQATAATRVIYGAFEVIGDDPSPALRSLRLSARTLDLRRPQHGQEHTQLGGLADLSSLATRLAWQALVYAAPALAPAEQDYLKAHPPARVEAVENYTRGLIAPRPEQRHRFFTEAARLDGEYSAPHYELGRIHFAAKNYRVAAGWLDRVAATDVRYLEAVFLLAICRHQLGQREGALSGFEYAAARAPLPEVINNLGVAQSRLDRPTAADAFRKALEADSLNSDYHFNLGYTLWRRGDFEAAAESFRAAIDRRPGDQEAIVFLGRCLKKSGPRAGDPRSEGIERITLPDRPLPVKPRPH